MKKGLIELIAKVQSMGIRMYDGKIIGSNTNEILAEWLLENGVIMPQMNKGTWVLYKPRRENRNATYKCLECEKLCSSYYNDVGEWKYCPHCGSKMEKEANKKNDTTRRRAERTKNTP